MKSSFLILLTALTTLTSGCSSNSSDESFIPSENSAASENYTNADGVPVDVTTEEYISGRQIGEEFYQSVDPFANPPYTGQEICDRALNTGYIFSFGKTVAVFPQARATLETTDGFQGCLDGFDGIPME